MLSFRFVAANNTIFDNIHIFLSSFRSEMESRLALRINHSYEDQVRAYRISYDDYYYYNCGIKTPQAGDGAVKLN